MAAGDFQAQVEGLTGLGTLGGSTTPTVNELTEFLKDGVNDVTSKWITIYPQDRVLFTRSSSESTSQYGLSNSLGKIISVVRETGTDGDFRECKPAPIGLQSRLTDVDSLHYASKYNPAYVIGGDGSIGVFPTPAGSDNAYKVYYVNSTPVNSSDASLIYSHSDINYFPEDKVYLVVLYAAIKALEAKMAEYTIDEEDMELVSAISSNLGTLKQQYEGTFVPVGKAPPPQQQAGAR